MTREIKKAAVIGSGVMGAAIAAQIANAGVECVLLDIVPKEGDNRNALAEGAVAKMLKTKPAPFMHPRNAKRITTGNLEDHLDLLKDCDWICEAIIENPEIKRSLYQKLEQVRKDGSIISSNTSTIPLKTLSEGLPARFKRDFAITHFFNPPRYMKLLEIVRGPDVDPVAIDALVRFGDVKLGKDVVLCKDTPGFIGNRIGILWMEAAINAAYKHGLTVEEADAVCGRPMSIPKTGIFGLSDLIGIDLTPHIHKSMLALLPKTDAFVRIHDPNGRPAAQIRKMIAEGNTGRKGKGGFYRAKGKEALDLETGEYRPKKKADLASAKAKGMRALAETDDRGGRFAWDIMAEMLSYAADLVPEIADDILAVDTAMKSGYGWLKGPFEQIDELGVEWFAQKLQAEGRPIPNMVKIAAGRPFYKEEGGKAYYMTVKGEYAQIPVAEGAWLLADKKRGAKPIFATKGASLWDLGDKVACLEIHTKMNSIDADVITTVREAAKIHERGFKALVIGNDADNFSVGANIGIALFQANIAAWPLLEQMIAEGQNAYLALKYAPFPVVAAPAGMALGGGCEICLHADAIQAHAEAYMGLVEVGVGVIPGWGGSKEMITRAITNKKRAGGPMPAVASVFEMISMAKVSTSADEARDMLILREGDGITMNRRRLLADAKAKALALAENYAPPKPVEIRLPGPTGQAALQMAVEGFVGSGKASLHDMRVSMGVARIITGGDKDMTDIVTEEELLALEREEFLKLLRTNATLDRIEHMLNTGKPLRN